ncbi:MAG: prepilin peptidase [Erythrobacter sp.]
MLEPALWPALALAALGAGLDIWQRKLSNVLCLTLAAASVGAVVYLHGPGLAMWGFVHAIIALIIGMALFKFDIIGGGDAKFYAAAALGVPGLPMASPFALLGWTAASGFLLVFAMMASRVVRKGASRQGLLKGWSVPYGVAIAAGLWLAHLV